MIDAGILEEVLYHIHNWFVYETIVVDECEIQNGELPASVSSSLLDGQWYRVQGSILNDGVHSHVASDLNDETFDGEIDTLVIPKALLRVVEDITEWVEDTAESSKKARQAPYQSESFGGYSYTIKSGSTSNSGSQGLTGWQAEFAGRLNPWRKMY